MQRIKYRACAVGLSVVVAVAVFLAGFHPVSAPSPTQVPNEKFLKAYANLPLTFVENRGQSDPHVRYYVQGPRFAFHLTQDEVVFSLAGESRRARELERSGPRVVPVAARTHEADELLTENVLALRFLGSNPSVVLEGQEPVSGEVNYLRGNDPAQWRTHLSSYAKVVYRELWPGIDMSVRDQSGTLKYEFRVSPGARPSDIRLAYSEAHWGSPSQRPSRLKLDASGKLLIQTPQRELQDSAPVAYQMISGSRVPVETKYALAGSEPTSYGFKVSSGYDPAQDLIIDPGLEYSTYLGGASHEYGAGIVVDAAGDAYIVGVTQSPDFPTTSGAFDRTGAAGNNLDVFVTKLNSTGTARIYSTFIGGNNFEWGRGIAVDTAGNAYLTGQTRSSDFPTTGGAFDRTLNIDDCPRCGVDQYDAFVTKLNPAGSALVYSTFLGGTDVDDGIRIALDAAGSAYVTGETASLNFPTTTGAFDRTHNGAFDAFVTKLNAAGSALTYSTFVGGAEVDFAAGIAIDRDGSNNAYVVGSTASPDFPATPGAFDASINGLFDAFVLKLNTDGSALLYATFLGGLDMDFGGGLTIDAAANAYVTGGTTSADFPTTPGTVSTLLRGPDAFVSKINPTGATLVYSTFLGGNGGDSASGIALDTEDNVYLAGRTDSADFPTTSGAAQTQLAGSGDAFVAALNSAGSALIYSTFLGGTAADGASDLALDADGKVYLTGQTLSTDFPTTPGVLDSLFNGEPSIFWADAFVAKLTLASAPPPTGTLSSVTTNPSSVTGGNSSVGTVTLAAAAPLGGASISLSSNNVAATVPPSVNVGQGATSATFAVTTSTVTIPTPVTIAGTFGGITRTATISVTPAQSSTRLQSLTVSSTSVSGGGAVQGTVNLTSTAPAGGTTVTLSSSNGAATVPASINVSQGTISKAFAIATTTVAASTSVNITAHSGGIVRTAGFTVNPVPQSVTLTVTATGHIGDSVSSSPGGIHVPVGNTMSANFATGTAITLRVSNNRAAVWSGPCSSGGNKTTTCSFTLTTNTAVIANVR